MKKNTVNKIFERQSWIMNILLKGWSIISKKKAMKTENILSKGLLAYKSKVKDNKYLKIKFELNIQIVKENK